MTTLAMAVVLGGPEVITRPCRAGSGRFCVPMAALLPAIRAECGILAGKMAGKRAREHEPFAAPKRLTPRTPDRVSGATGAAGWVVKCPSPGSQLAWWPLRSAPQW